MEFTQTATLKRTVKSSRDVGTHRRAYLDTYARRRAGLSDVAPITAPQPVEAIQQAPSIPLEAPTAQPAVVAVPTLPQQTATQAEPSFVYSPKPQYSQQNSQHDNQTSHKTYLDVLVNNHHNKVSQAPQAIETVATPVITENTSQLIDTEAHERMSANLEALYNSKPLTEHIAKNKTSASASHVRTIVASALTCGMLSVAIFSFVGRYDPQQVIAQPIGAPVIEVEAPVNNTPTGAPVVSKEDNTPHANPSDPVRIIASSIGLNARVNGIGTTSDGLIAVPKSYTSVGWYNKASRPGEEGPSVLVGHYTGGNGGVFDKLSSLNDGDLITVKNGRSQVFTYKITKKAEYQRDQVPMTEIFKKNGASRLEIITCAGKWQSNAYDNRFVVTAELVQ
jgi:LPXTG-site transpeptidase (sortase) family protein